MDPQITVAELNKLRPTLPQISGEQIEALSKTDPDLAQRIIEQHGLLTLRYENSGFSAPLDLGVESRFLAA